MCDFVWYMELNSETEFEEIPRYMFPKDEINVCACGCVSGWRIEN